MSYYGNHFKILTGTGGVNNFAMKLKPNGAITDDTNGVFLNKYDNHFKIDTTGVDENKLKLKMKPNGAINDDTNGIS